MAGGYGARAGELAGVADTVLRHAAPLGELADRVSVAEVREGDLGAAFTGAPSAYAAAVQNGVVAALRNHSAATTEFGGMLSQVSGRYLADDETGSGTVQGAAQ